MFAFASFAVLPPVPASYQSISHKAQILPLSVVAVKRGLVNASKPWALSSTLSFLSPLLPAIPRIRKKPEYLKLAPIAAYAGAVNATTSAIANNANRSFLMCISPN